MRVTVNSESEEVNVYDGTFDFYYKANDHTITICNVGLPGVNGPHLTFSLQDIIDRENKKALAISIDKTFGPLKPVKEFEEDLAIANKGLDSLVHEAEDMGMYKDDAPYPFNPGGINSAYHGIDSQSAKQGCKCIDCLP